MAGKNSSSPRQTTWNLPVEYDAKGWRGVFPLPVGQKTPPPEGVTGENARNLGKQEWPNPPFNVGARMPTDVVGIDVDTYGDKRGADQLADLEAKLGTLPETWVSSSREEPLLSGIRFFRVPRGKKLPGKLAADIDVIQAHHRYAVVEPSVVEGRAYRWYRPNGKYGKRPPMPSELPFLPEPWLVVDSPGAVGLALPGTLEALLALPADDPLRGNDWLTRVAGHLAREHFPNKDAYLVALKDADNSSDRPHGVAPFRKTANSVWSREEAKSRVGLHTGYLQPADGYGLMIQIKNDDGETKVRPFANFDIEALGVVQRGDARRAYDVIVRKSNGGSFRTLLESETLADPRRFSSWETGCGLAVFTHVPPLPSNKRIALYLESQEPPLSVSTDHLGWHKGVGFVTRDSIIRPQGRGELTGLLPDPALASWFERFSYGFRGDPKQARKVLRRVMEFHFPEYTSVFAAWLTMLILRGQYPLELFPVFNVESSAETGKSRGFFPLMLQLFGHKAAGGQATAAAMRDLISAHANGCYWVDDAAQLGYLADLMRQMTGSGERSKKGEDGSAVETVQLRGGLLVSGEGLGTMASEPAMRHRFVTISNMRSPIGRRSTRDPNRAQIEDIESLQNKYDRDLTQLAGHVIQAVLVRAPMLGDMRDLATGAGRMAEINALLRIGARIFADVIGDDRYVALVDAYCEDRSNDSVLTFLEREVIPYLVLTGQLSRKAGQALYLDDQGRLRIQPNKAAKAWRERRNGLSDREAQLGSQQAIGMDLIKIGASKAKTTRVVDGTYLNYRTLDRETSTRALDAAGYRIDT